MNLPIEFEKKMKDFLGDEWEEFLYSYDNNRFQASRFNTLKVGKDKGIEQEIAGIMDKLGIPMDKKLRGRTTHIIMMRISVPENTHIMRWDFIIYKSRVRCRR